MQYPRTAINFVLNKRASMQRSSRRESQFYKPSWTACVFRFPIPPEKFASFPLGSRPHATWRSCAQPPPHEIRRRRLANMKSATSLIEATFPPLGHPSSPGADVMSQMEAPVREVVWNPTARGQSMSVCNMPEPDAMARQG